MIARADIDRLEFEDMNFQYPDGMYVFKNINCKFPPHETIILDGQEGVGLSTLLKLMAAFLQPTSGRYLINTHNVREMSFEEFLPYRLNIGYSFDTGGLLSNRTVEENLLLPLLYHKEISIEEAHHRVDEIIHIFDLDKDRNSRPFRLAGGRKNLTCVARAILIRPQLLLLDNPTIGMTEELIKRFTHLLNEYRREFQLRHIFIVSRDPLLRELLKPNQMKIEQAHYFPVEAVTGAAG